MSITNINYKGCLDKHVLDTIDFSSCKSPPFQRKFALNNGCMLLVFPSGKCRLMGFKIPITAEEISDLPFHINNLQIQSMSLVINLQRYINLYKLARNLPRGSSMYEPELFPALRLCQFNPLCVNVFNSGKVVVLGVKELTNQNLIEQIVTTINIGIN